MKEEIIELANKIGLDCIGFCGIEFEEAFIIKLKDRREREMLSGFEERNELIRSDVKRIMEDAKTMISVALPYQTKDFSISKEADVILPDLSMSAKGLDYHRVMKNKLDILCEFIYNRFGAKALSFCDTSPLPDREIAKMCGIGYYGKNTNIITEKYGSFVFLGEILTNLVLDTDMPNENNCGSCEACMKACPAKAIVEPYILNAQKCLSYISQKKEQLTYEEMQLMGTSVYGCDKCQTICPRNKKKSLSNFKEMVPEVWNEKLDIEGILNMSNKEFKQTFGMTASGWRGKKLFQRNMIIAMGNSKNLSFLPILETMKDKELNYYIRYAITTLKNN